MQTAATPATFAAFSPQGLFHVVHPSGGDFQPVVVAPATSPAQGYAIAAPRTVPRAPRNQITVVFEHANREYLDAFLSTADARASIDEHWRDNVTKKGMRTELVIGALRRTGWCFKQDGTFGYDAASDCRAGLRSQLADCERQITELQQEKTAAELAAVQATLDNKSVHEVMALRRTKEQQAEVAQERSRAQAAEDAARAAEARQATAERARETAERARERTQKALDEALLQVKALGSAPSRTQLRQELRQELDAERRLADAATGERLVWFEAQLCEQLQARQAADRQVAEMETQVRSEQTRRGLMAAELEAAKVKLAKVNTWEQDGTLRNQARREKARVDELTDARAEVTALRQRVGELEAAAPLVGPRGTQQPKPPVLQALRVSGGDENAPFTGRSIEFMRRLVDETNGSFEGAATANALVLAMHLGAEVTDDQLITAGSIRNAFSRGGLADEEAAAERNRADEGPWCIAQDAGGGTLMVATGHWDLNAMQPIARPLAAADLFRDQTARNGIATLERAAARSGLRYERLVASCSDGTEHAVQESRGFCERAHELGGRGQCGRGQLGQADFCCIHGKALEENSGQQAAFPDNYLVDALRLLWELVGGPEGRPAHYRAVWERQVDRADGTKLPALPVALFDQHLKALPEPTEAKWQARTRVSRVGSAHRTL